MSANRPIIAIPSGGDPVWPDSGGSQRLPAPEPAWFRYQDFLGLALKLLRIKFGIRQADLAVLLSVELSRQVAQGYISRIERSKRGITHERLALICKLLDCTPSRVIAMAESLAMNAPRSEIQLPGNIDPNGDLHPILLTNGRANGH